MHKTQDITSGDYLKPKSLAPGKNTQCDNKYRDSVYEEALTIGVLAP